MVTKVPADIVVPEAESTQGSETIVKIVLPPLNEPAQTQEKNGANLPTVNGGEMNMLAWLTGGTFHIRIGIPGATGNVGTELYS